MRRDRRWAKWALLLAGALRAWGAETGPAWGLAELREFFDPEGKGFGRKDWEQASRGGARAKTLERSDGREVLVAGMIGIRAGTACYLRQFENIESFKKGKMVTAVHKITGEPKAADLENVALTAKEELGLRDCRPGQCDLKLPEAAMKEIGEALGRQGGTQQGRAEAAFRRWLTGYLQAYWSMGNRALTGYDSGKQVRLREEVEEMLAAKPSLKSLAPEFHEYLLRYPEAKPAGVRGFLYWSTEEFGLKPVTSVTHASIFEQPGRAILASKQIYATHYFDASLGLTFLLDAEVDGRPGAYLVYLNRSRIDLLRGWLAGIRRFFLRRRLLNGVKDNLREVAFRVGEACRDEPVK